MTPDGNGPQAPTYGRVRALWIAVRLQLWAVFCALDDYFGVERIGARRKE